MYGVSKIYFSECSNKLKTYRDSSTDRVLAFHKAPSGIPTLALPSIWDSLDPLLPSHSLNHPIWRQDEAANYPEIIYFSNLSKQVYRRVYISSD